MPDVRTDPDWRDGFLFVGNQPALDFLNTRPVIRGEPTELLPDVAALLRWFVAAELLSAREAGRLQREWAGSSRARRSLEAVRNLRERLRTAVVAWEGGGAVREGALEELNRIMTQHPVPTRIEARDGALVAELKLTAREPEDLLGPLAYWAAMLFAHVDRTRVRQCGACVLHFYDNSKKGNRRWCSMQLCGNRAKVAAYQARKRGRE
jgi:predicted RNA-binding Zn ribbon-like protein